MLWQRVLSALVGIPLVIVLVRSGGAYLAVPMLLLAGLAVGEMRSKCKAKSIQVFGMVAWPFALALPAIAFLWTESSPLGPFVDLPTPLLDGPSAAILLLTSLLYLVIGSLLVALLRYHRDQTVPVVNDVGATVLTGLYVGVPFAFILLLRHWSVRDAWRPEYLDWPFGARILLFCFCATWATDTGAYFVGRSLGKHKLTPASPNKTVEGAIGGWTTAVVVGMLAGWLLGLPMLLAAVASACMGVMGQLGDLAKSIMKRDLGTKDFGALIPGHGGVLDRFDSLMVNAPVVFLCELAILGWG